MRVPRASAQQILCPGSEGCDCFDDGTIRVDVGTPSDLADCACFYAQHIYVFGLCEGQTLTVDREWKDPCDPLWGPWITCGRALTLTQCDPEALLTVPGRYRINLLQEGCEELDPEHVRVQVTKIPAASAALRLQERATCCCEGHYER